MKICYLINNQPLKDQLEQNVTRWDYLATMFTEAITVNAPEKIANIETPKRRM
jgi:NADH:ubiquinone oxidoreductase subunit D